MLSIPKIFISSTIYDFKDLRSSLKYWLTCIGYNVQMSEFSDFEKDIELNSYEACLNAIEKCDYYVLLIGSRVGGLYDKEKRISITQQEYRHALMLHEKGIIKKLIIFVRQDVWDNKNDINEMRAYIKTQEESNELLKLAHLPTKHMSNPEFIISFIEEVGKTNQMREAIRSHASLPRNNWIHVFSSFEDIISTLTFELSIPTNISIQIWQERIMQEIIHDLSIICIHNPKRNEIYSHFMQFTDVSDYLYNMAINSLSSNQIVDVSGRILLSVKDFLQFPIIGANCLKYDSINEAVKYGIFMRYDSTNRKPTTTCIHDALTIYLEEVHSLMISDSSLNKTNPLKHMNDLVDEMKYPVHSYLLIQYTMLHDNLYNILELAKYISTSFQAITIPFPKLKLRSSQRNGFFTNPDIIRDWLTNQTL